MADLSELYDYSLKFYNQTEETVKEFLRHAKARVGFVEFEFISLPRSFKFGLSDKEFRNSRGVIIYFESPDDIEHFKKDPVIGVMYEKYAVGKPS